MFLTIIGILVLIVVVVYLYFTWNSGYWKKHGILYEEPKFFYGNLSEAIAGKIHMGLIYTNLYRKFTNVPYFGFYNCQHPALVIRDLDIIKDVLVKEFNSFATNEFHVNSDTDPVLAENPFVVTGEEWKAKRSQLSRGMTPNSLKLMFDIMADKATLTVEHLRKHIENNPKEPVDVRDIAVNYLTDTIVASVFGLQINSFKDPNNEFKNIAGGVTSIDYWSGILQMCFLIAPWVSKILGTGLVDKNTVKRLIAIAKQVIEIRKKNGFVKNDFFEVCFKTGKEVSEMDVAGKIHAFLLDGVEVSSGAISSALYELAVNPHVQTKLRHEIEESIQENDGKITYEAIHSLPFLDQVVNETLRLHPPGLSINRICTKSYEIPPVETGRKPFLIPVGMVVVIPTYAIGMDPEYFNDPEIFDPERFSKENKLNIKKFSFLPFGEGPRICAGRRLGLTNAKNGISNIIKNFEVRLSSKTKTPWQIDPNIVDNRPVGGIWLTFHEISK